METKMSHDREWMNANTHCCSGTNSQGTDISHSKKLNESETVQREGEELVHLARRLRHEDPITHEPGCHAVGTGLGAIVGGVTTGAATGALFGPAGTVIGTAVGAVLGGLAGKAVNEVIDPTVEIAYWRGAYHTRDYFHPERPFEQYEYAYRMGIENFELTQGIPFDEAEPAMRSKWENLSTWESEGGAAPMSWEEAKQAARDSYERLLQANRSSNRSSS